MNKKIIYISNGLKFIWAGGHGINIYRDDEEIDFINVGDFANNEATKKEVEEGIKDYIKDIKQNYLNIIEKEIEDINFGEIIIKIHQGKPSSIHPKITKKPKKL